MRKTVLSIAAGVLALVLGVPAVFAHGGSYRHPPGTVPPGQRDPRDPQPPPENPGTPTDPANPGTGTGPPGGGTPSDPGGGGGQPPAPPGGPGASPGPGLPGAGPGGIGSGGRRSPPAPVSMENWAFWWAYNKDDLLDLNAALARSRRSTPEDSSPFFFGPGRDGSVEAPTDRRIRDLVVPALEATVANRDIHPDIRGGAIIALARCPGPDHSRLYMELADPKSKEDSLVYESALLALGIAQEPSPEVSAFLVRIADDVDYPTRGRCFALASLGLLRDRSEDAFACFRRRLEQDEANRDLPVVALLAIGLAGDPERAGELSEWLGRRRVGARKLDSLEVAWVVEALGRLENPTVLDDVVDALRDRSLLVRRSAMVALGRLVPKAPAADRMKHLETIVRAVREEKDSTARNFGTISIGRVAGAADAPDRVRDAAVTWLLRDFRESNRVTERPFAALALGLTGFGEDKPKALRYELATPIRQELAELRGDKLALGSLAVSLGMLRDGRRETVDLLGRILSDRGEDRRLRACAALGLGLIGDPAGKAPVMAALEEREDRDLRVQTAVAAGLLGDSDAVGKLVDVLGDPKSSQYVLGSVALALGQIGDESALEPLLGILEPGVKNGSYPDLTRALVAVALGQLADSAKIPVLSRISKDVNYRATVPSLEELLTIL